MNRTNTNWGSTGPKEMSRSHGWTSSSHGVRKTLQGNKEFSSQDRVMGKRSPDAQKKGFLGARSSPNSAGRSKPVKSDFLPFEVRMNDFPELAGNKSAPCHVENWRSSSPPKQSPAFSWTSGRREIPSQPECQQITTNTTSDSSTIAQSQAALTSWANIASQPPRKPASHKSKICSNLQSEDNPEQQEDVTSGKKKRRKKKKKTKSEDVEAESEAPASYQEPPKIEDEEEFPGLFLSLTVNDRMMPSSNAAKLCYEKIQKEGFHHLNDPSKENLNLPKGQVGAQNTQKTEKMSGKKSKAPVQLDIGNVLATLEKKQQTQKNRQDAKSVILSVGGGLPVVQKQPPVQKKLPWQKDKIAHNPLDSTSPLVKKGKQREVPKAKKPTPLKKVILKEREERKQRRLLEERGLLPEQECQPDDEAAEEEQHNTSGEVGSPAEELSDLSALNDANQVAKDCDEELETDQTDQTVEQQIAASPSVSYPAGRPKIHSRKFRDYCTQMLSKDVDECVTTLLKELVRFQDRLYQKDPIKARMKRRIVMGLREVQKHLKLRKLKCVIISPNCERIQSKGGLDEALHTIIDTCREQAVPFVFALSRRALGRCVNKAVPVSLVGIFNYDGAQDFYHKMIELSSEARTAYEVMLSNLEQTDAEEAQQTSPLAEKVETSSGDPQPEEPEYLKIWNKIFEQDRSNQLLNFEKQLSFMHLESECIETTNGEES